MWLFFLEIRLFSRKFGYFPGIWVYLLEFGYISWNLVYFLDFEYFPIFWNPGGQCNPKEAWRTWRTSCSGDSGDEEWPWWGVGGTRVVGVPGVVRSLVVPGGTGPGGPTSHHSSDIHDKRVPPATTPQTYTTNGSRADPTVGIHCRLRSRADPTVGIHCRLGSRADPTVGFTAELGPGLTLQWDSLQIVVSEGPTRKT